MHKKDGKKKREGARGHTSSALIMVEKVSDVNWYGSEEALVVALELALIKNLNLDVGRFSNGTAEGCESG